MEDLRRHSEIEEDWMQSISEMKQGIQSRFRQLSLKDVPFQVFTLLSLQCLTDLLSSKWKNVFILIKHLFVIFLKFFSYLQIVEACTSDELEEFIESSTTLSPNILKLKKEKN